MTITGQTRPSLLIRLRNQRDSDAWSNFAEVYGPMVYAFARRQGHQDADAADLVQDVLREVSRSIPKFDYDPALGKFRSWLYTIARRAMGRNVQRARTRGTGDSATIELLENVANSNDDSEAVWQRLYHQQLLHWAADQIRDDFKESTWEAFWQTAVEERSPSDVAAGLQISVGNVYVARNRVMKKLSQKIREIDESE